MVETIHTLDVTDKRVLVRVDYNVPLDEQGAIEDDRRIEASLPTLKELISKGAKQLVLMTHIGRPDGEVVEKLKTNSVAKKLSELLGEDVVKVDNCIDIALPDVRVVMLENLRFHKEEEENDSVFAEKLSQHGDIFVNDAFGTAHRAHASTVGVCNYLPGGIGLLIEKELQFLDVEKMEQPLVAILGGAKLKTKLPLINKILPHVDKILLGGAMVFTFYKAMGKQIGTSLCDEESVTMAQMLLENKKIVLPSDIVIAHSPEQHPHARTVHIDGIPASDMGLDIGEESITHFKEEIAKAKTIVWNGPLGYVEEPPFDTATDKIMHYLATLSDITTIVGGGDSIKMVDKMKLGASFTHVSTGGGASMKLLEGKELPAISALEK